jgi:hypothetical protein
VLKKAGIVVSITAAGMLLASPVAMAQNLSNNCSLTQSGGQITSVVTGGGVVTIAPVTTQVSALNCNNVNVSDVVDNNSNNVTVSEVRTRVQNSFNTLVFLRGLLGR